MKSFPSRFLSIGYNIKILLFVNKPVDDSQKLCYHAPNFIFLTMREGISLRGFQRAGGRCEPVPKQGVTASGVCPVNAVFRPVRGHGRPDTGCELDRAL